ncbi:putative chromo domain shadow protein [Neofusicoccum parvum]|uniref:Chromo domain shadow protein n=1 Tax=Neofusicoccum parvum TaxID=310453 RepID=A0ACB5SPW8_9PEZI|nr:putative chromo domain shadow protein [Neofusicoccum parvum]
MSDASRPAKRACRTATTKTTTTPTARLSSQAAAHLTSAAADDLTPDFHHRYVPSRAIAPIAPTPPSQCPLPRARATLVSRQYDLASGQPLYRVRIEPRRSTPPRHGPASASDPPRSPSLRAASDEPRREEGESQDNGAARELDVWLDDVLEYVSAAELERFELGYEDDVVVMVDEDGAVLLVRKEARRAMAGLPPVGAEAPRAGGVPGKVRRKKAPTREFVDALPVVKRGRGRPRKTAAVMGVVAESDGEAESVGVNTAEGEAEETAAEVGTATDTEIEGIDYGLLAPQLLEKPASPLPYRLSKSANPGPRNQLGTLNTLYHRTHIPPKISGIFQK